MWPSGMEGLGCVSIFDITVKLGLSSLGDCFVMTGTLSDRVGWSPRMADLKLGLRRGRSPGSIAVNEEESTMAEGLDVDNGGFVDRRQYGSGAPQPAVERRQFTNSHEGLSPEAQELAVAIDQYKLNHRRRFITYEEMLSVIKAIGYRKQ
jgi:hypothetical protein